MYHFIVNPAGAAGKTGSIWKKLEPVVQRCRVEYEVHFSSLERSISDICSELTKGTEPVKLIVFGGDGSINEAINGLCRLTDVQLGFVPCGSGNDLARDIGITDNLETLLLQMLEGITRRKIDIGEVFCEKVEYLERKFRQLPEELNIRRRFAVSCGIGFDADICEGVDHSMWKNSLNKLGIGKLSYLAVASRLIAKNESFQCDIQDEEGKQLHFDRCLFAVIMNHRFEGGGFRFCPNATDNDGILDLCVAHDFNVASYLKVMPKCYSGNHVKYTNKVHIDRSSKYTISADRPLFVHTDGEVTFKSEKIEVSLLNEQLSMLV